MAWNLDVSWVTPLLAVGGTFPMEAAQNLARDWSIRHVVDCREEASDDPARLAAAGMDFLNLPTPDRTAIVPPLLRRGVGWASRFLTRGERVYIHCEHGIGRSAELALCLLVRSGWTPLSALTQAKHARPCVSPSPEQLEGFMLWAEGWRVVHRLAWHLPSFEQLSRIAWARPS